MRNTFRQLSRVLVAMSALGCGVAAAADDHQVRAWAASCASCHGTDGRSLGGMPALAGVDQDKLLQALLEFKSDKRAATIMHQLAKGYSDDELSQLARHFARQQP